MAPPYFCSQLSAIFSLEQLAYCTLTYAAVAVARAWLEPPGGRGRRLAADAGRLVLAWIVANAKGDVNIVSLP